MREGRGTLYTGGTMVEQQTRMSRRVEVRAVGAESPGWIEPIRERVDGALSAFIDGADLPESLREAVRYATVQGGKRVRPVLAWLCAQSVGGTGEASLPAGCAVECVHAFSLVHDDLPALDDDDLRRGLPTLHKHAGEAMAILAGDALLTLAFGAIDGAEGPVRRDALRRELVAGTVGMIGGQVYDTLGGMPAELDERAQLELIHRGKTAALLRASCRMGAICALPGGGEGETDEERLEAVSAYGEAVGLLFQVVDDLIDVEGTSDVAGKRTGKDAEAGKTTYPGLLGLEGSRRAADVLLESARAAARKLGAGGERLEELAVYMRWRTR